MCNDSFLVESLTAIFRREKSAARRASRDVSRLFFASPSPSPSPSPSAAAPP
jgi:hypothetical protein